MSVLVGEVLASSRGTATEVLPVHSPHPVWLYRDRQLDMFGGGE